MKLKALCLAVLFTALSSVCAHAATLTVTNTKDRGTGSLRAAIIRAESGDLITFASAVTGTITLDSELKISKELAIVGPGANELAISGGDKNTIFNVQKGFFFVSNVSFVHCGDQGAITNFSRARVEDCIFSDNFGFSYDSGLISNYKTMTITNCAFFGNVMLYNGAIRNVGEMNVSHCTFSNNMTYGWGAAVVNLGVIHLDDCKFSGNSSSSGGAIYNYAASFYTPPTSNLVAIRNCTISGNTASGSLADYGGKGGAILCLAGNMTIENSAITGNKATESGGAIYHLGRLTINNSTLSGNQTRVNGGALDHEYGTAVIRNSTLSGNEARNSGGAIFAFASLFLRSCTVTGNSADAGGGFRNYATNYMPAPIATIVNSIIAGNHASEGADVRETFFSKGYNLIGIGDGSSGFVDGENGDQVGSESAPIDAKLGPLHNNGGLTKTHALLPGSPAIDKGKHFGLNSDQRRFHRPIDNPTIADATGGDGSDIGAYEADIAQSGPTFIVTTTDDNNDGLCGAEHCSLREAINAANAHSSADTIKFNIPQSDAGYNYGAFTIQPKSALPVLRDDDTTINGSSQAGFRDDPIIVLNGIDAGDEANGLEIRAAHCTIRSLVVHSFGGGGVVLRGKRAANNRVEGCFIGIDVIGYRSFPNGRHGTALPDGELIVDGIDIVEGANHNIIGGTGANDGNILSGGGDFGNGVFIAGKGSDNNVVQGNYIGTDISGSSEMGNYCGVEIAAGAGNNLIGGGSEAGNIISGNRFDGVLIRGKGTKGNRVQGNTIGLDVSGSYPIGNTHAAIYTTNTPQGGVRISQAAQDNLIGGTAPGTGNIISGNAEHGVVLTDAGTSGNRVQGNLIGPDGSGTQAIGNSLDGFGGGASAVYVSDGARNNLIGGTSAKAGNIISGNFGDGIAFFGTNTRHNAVQGNTIGLDTSGTKAMPNFGTGVFIATHSNFVGGSEPGARNVIASNSLVGIEIFGDNNLVQGNFIGTDKDGTKALGNKFRGIDIFGVNNLIGGTQPGTRNIVSGNGYNGIDIISDNNRVQGNFIGTDKSGTKALGNGSSGISISGFRDSTGALIGAKGNLIGGSEPGARNVISGNNYDGIGILGDNNRVQGNFIGVDATGTKALGNKFIGVNIFASENSDGVFTGAPQDNLIGGIEKGARNIISGNGSDGIQISDIYRNPLPPSPLSTTASEKNSQIALNAASLPGDDAPTMNNFVQGNFIGTDISGKKALANQGAGIVISLARNNTIGGTQPDARNIISGNQSFGVILSEGKGNIVQGNFIGTDSSGAAALPNFSGLYLVYTSNSLIGGITTGAGNLISGNRNHGILLEIANGDHVQGNIIGLNKTGGPLPNGFVGIEIKNGSHGNFIGGSMVGEGNHIAYNRAQGVLVSSPTSDISTTGNTIRGNAIFSNQALGIDLTGDFHGDGDGITPNDRRDVDSGPNNLQNYPLLSRAATSGSRGGVRGSLNSLPSTSFALDFYANSPNNSGQVYLGQKTVTTNANGDAGFTFSLAQSLSNRSIMTTATNLATGDTSEFSRAVIVNPQADNTAPGVSFNRSLSNPRTLSGTAFDAGSGIAQVFVLLTPATDQPGQTITREAQVTLGQNGTASFIVDLSGLPPGSYRVQAQAFDLVGNSGFSETTKYRSDATFGR